MRCLRVTAHEFFHLWNVKRIRPQSLEPIDYTKENYTRALWFSEGCTSTAADIIQLRAGLLDEQHISSRLGSDITELERRPAHLTQSAEESSLDAWLEGFAYYRRPERSISYYNKGELLGIMLDLAVREASHGQASLREVFQWMNQNYAKKGPFLPRFRRRAPSRRSRQPFRSRPVLHEVRCRNRRNSLERFLSTVGLRLDEGKTTIADAGFIASRNFDGPMIGRLRSPRQRGRTAGLQVGDRFSKSMASRRTGIFARSIAQLKPGRHDHGENSRAPRRRARVEMESRQPRRNFLRTQRPGERYRQNNAHAAPRGSRARRKVRTRRQVKLRVTQDSD